MPGSHRLNCAIAALTIVFIGSAFNPVYAEETAPVIVAIIDSGIDYHHEDLKGMMWVNTAERDGVDYVDDDGNGCVDDIHGCDVRSLVRNNLGYYPGLGGPDYEKDRYMRPDGIGHGTHVAGLIGAQRHNGIGIDGLAVNVQLMAVTFINPGNSANMADAAIAIRYAVDNGAKIINCSFGQRYLDPEVSDQLRDAVTYADAHGVLVIAAAGNYGHDLDAVDSFFPASLRQDNMIIVAALDVDGGLWQHSNYGMQSVDIAAAGTSVYSTVPKGEISLFRKLYDPSGYMISEGTSIATPRVTALVANLYQQYPGTGHYQIRQMVLDQAVSNPALTGKIRRGAYVAHVLLGNEATP